MPPALCLCNHRRHALKYIIAKDEVVKEGNGGMASGQGPKCPGPEFMHQMKRGPQRLVARYQLWNLPQE